MLNSLRPIGTIARAWADTTYSSFTDSLVELYAYSQLTLCKPGEFIYYDKGLVSWHSSMRNDLVKNMKGDWLFMTDTDHVFAPDLLVRLMRMADKYGADVISGAYTFKHPPHGPVACLWPAEGAGAIPIKDWDRSADCLEMGCFGGGCLFVRRRVFSRIQAQLNEEPFDLIPGLSEDYAFCKRCQQVGIPVWWAPKIESHHCIRTLLSIKDYQPPIDTMKVPVQGGVVNPKSCD